MEPWLADLPESILTRLWREDGLPSTVHADLLVALGSPSSVAVGHESPATLAEVAFVQEWVGAGRPYLGVCFGAQTLARATGGTVQRMSRTYRALAPLPCAAGAPESLAGPWVVWHEDAIAAPAGATVLSRLPHADLAFQTGRAVGLQPHVEVTAESLQRMLAALKVPAAKRGPMVTALEDAQSADPARATRLGTLLTALVTPLLG